MPDLDSQLTRLRDDLNTMPRPEFETVVARAKQRSVRRRMQIAAIAAVVAVSVAVPLLRGPLGPDLRTPPASGDLPTTPFVTKVVFADNDSDNGAALRYVCEDGDPDKCAAELLLTTDGGVRWEARAVDELSGPGWGTPISLGADELVVDRVTARTRTVLPRIHSSDGGRTWREVPMPVPMTDTTDAIPEAGALTSHCARYKPGGRLCVEWEIAVVMPGTGRDARLTTLPALDNATPGHKIDGRWWVVGQDPDSHEWLVVSSDDDGRTWTTSSVGQVPSAGQVPDVKRWTIVANETTLFAVASGHLADTSSGLLAILRSTDDGQTWQQTWRAADGQEPHVITGDPIATENGRLIIRNSVDDRVYVSADEGRTFEKVKNRFPGHEVQWTPAGYVTMDLDLHLRSFEISADGITWRPLTFGAG